MLHTVLGQVAPTFLPPPWSHDLSVGFRAAPFLTPSSRHTHITEGQTRGPAGHKQADKNKQTMACYINCNTVPSHLYTHTPPTPTQPSFTDPGQAAAAARGAGAEGSNPRCRSHRQGSLS